MNRIAPNLGRLDRFFRHSAERKMIEHRLSGIAREIRKRFAAQHREIRGDGADVRRDRHLVVVQDDDEIRTHLAGVVERLVREAAGKRAVAEHGDDRFVASRMIARFRHAQRRRNARACMTGTEAVVLGLAAHREARQTAALANRRKAIAPPGQNLMHVALMADVPNDPVGGQVQHLVQRERQLDDAQIGSKMAPVLRADRNEHVSNLLREPCRFRGG